MEAQGINLEAVTIEDAVFLYYEHKSVILNDGRCVGIEKESKA